MLNILINAYAVSPNWGSEQGVGWNWIVNIAKYCNCYIITESEYQKEIEEAVEKIPYKDHLHFYFNAVTPEVRKMCWNQGDWRFYLHYEKWQRKTLVIARDICNKHKIDVIHHLNMVCFREPGYLWQINDIPFVWGPISGFNPDYFSFLNDMGVKFFIKSKTKNIINNLQLRFSPRVRKAFLHADGIITTTPYCKEGINKLYHKNAYILNETGINCGCIPIDSIKKINDGNLNLLWVGRFIKTKKLDIALRTIERLKDLKNIRLHIVGFGSGDEETSYRSLAHDLGIENLCIWHGKQENARVQELMRQMDVFFFTSIGEATSTVIPEAIQNRLPILCHDACAFGPLIKESIGWKIKPVNPETSIKEFSTISRYIYYNQDKLTEMWRNFDEVAEILSYENKGKIVYNLYKQLTGKE